MPTSEKSFGRRTTRMTIILKYSVGILFAGRLLKLKMQVRTQKSPSINSNSNSPKYMRKSYRWANETQQSNWINDGNSTNDDNIANENGDLINEDDNSTDTDTAPFKSPFHSSTDNNNHSVANNTKEQRIIILPGPHKSATTSVQTYLVHLAKEKVLSEYNWSWVGGEAITGFVAISRYLLYEPIEGKQDKLERVRIDTNKKWEDGYNLIVASEFMDYVASLSEKEARVSIKRLLDWLPNVISNKQIEAIIMYRSPRVSHLISAWKQQTQFRKASTTLPWRISLDKKKRQRKKFDVEVPTLAEWLCYGEYPTAMQYNIKTILSAQINPFGLAYAYSTYGGMSTTMMDMTNSDVSSSVVCDVLGLPCDDGKLSVGQKTVPEQKNHKSEKSDLGMNDSHLALAEEIIRDTGCYYYCLLGDKVKVLHGVDEVFQDGEMSWNTCCRRNKKKDIVADGKWMANQLIQLGCDAINESGTNQNN